MRGACAKLVFFLASVTHTLAAPCELCEAAENGDLEKVKSLLSNKDVDMEKQTSYRW